MAVHVLGQVCRWIHHGFREGSFHAGTEAVGVILSNPPIRHQVLESVFQDPGGPMHPVEMEVSCFQQKISQGVGIEHAAIKNHRENSRLQPKAHDASPWRSWPEALSCSSMALRR